MQPHEGDGEIFVLVIDETYGGDEETYEADSENYRQRLEKEFNAVFAPENVGPGYDIPAFLTVLTTPWAVLLAAFFLGKRINENIDAWKDIVAKIRRFFSRPILLSRHGAAALAIEAIFDKMGGTPKNLQLLSYRPHYAEDDDDLQSLPTSHAIEPAPPILNLGRIQHVFEIEADGALFRVAIDGTTVRVVQIGHPAK